MLILYYLFLLSYACNYYLYQQREYCSGSLRSDQALVRHLNAVARRKSKSDSNSNANSPDAMLRSKWEDFKPSEDDLIRSQALKVRICTIPLNSYLGIFLRLLIKLFTITHGVV
jgi:hypothetical protein